MKGSFKKVRKFGIDLNARDDDGETGFMCACLHGSTYIVVNFIH